MVLKNKMKVIDIINEQHGSNPEPKLPNPIPFDKNKVYNSFELADEVEGELANLYKKEHGITQFQSGRDYANALKIQRKKFGKIIDVPINKITASEPHLYQQQLDALLQNKDVRKSSEIPIIYKIGKDYIVGDGNHRIAATAMQGNKSIKALVLDFDKINKQIK